MSVPFKNNRNLKFSMEEISSLYAENTDPQKAAVELRKHTGGFETLYNPDAQQYLEDHHIFKPLPNETPYLDAQLQKVINLPLTKHDLTPFPSKSMIAKAIWVPVSITRTGSTIPVSWAPPGCNDCPTEINIVQNDQECNLQPLQKVLPPIPISCFYNVDAEEHGTRFALVGLHVITKELEDWTWTTFWWYPNPNIQNYGDDRPDTISKPWNNYLMDTTISMVDPEEREVKSYEDMDVPKDPCGQSPDIQSKAKICFNPFLEGKLQNGKLSNCMNCHIRATYPFDAPELMGSPRRGQITKDNTCFAGKIRLDYLWTLRRAPVTKPNVKFDKFVTTVNSKLLSNSP